MNDPHAHTIIVGGGISGLCVAHRLLTAPDAPAVRLFEASDYLGGNVRTDNVDGYLCDWGPNGFLDREPAMLDWVKRLGLEPEMIQADEASAHRFLLLNGRLVEIKPPPAFLFSPVLSPRGKARIFLEPFIAPRRDDTPETVFDFAARRIGTEAAETLVSAMVLGVFGGDAKQLSLDHCFPRMAEMEQKHGSLFKAMRVMAKEKKAGRGGPTGPSGRLTSFTNGIGRLVERAAFLLGDNATTEASVQSVVRSDHGFTVTRTDGIRQSASNVVLATPAWAAAGIVQKMAPEAASALREIRYANMAVVCVGFPRERVAHNLKGFGFLVPPNEGRETLGCMWASSIFPPHAPEGKALFRVMLGGPLNPEVAGQSDEELIALIRRDVYAPLGITGEPDCLRIFRYRRAIAQYGIHHGAVLDAVEAAERNHPGLYFTGNAYRGVSMNDCVKDAYRIVDEICDPADTPAVSPT